MDVNNLHFINYCVIHTENTTWRCFSKKLYVERANYWTFSATVTITLLHLDVYKHQLCYVKAAFLPPTFRVHASCIFCSQQHGLYIERLNGSEQRTGNNCDSCHDICLKKPSKTMETLRMVDDSTEIYTGYFPTMSEAMQLGPVLSFLLGCVKVSMSVV